MAVKLSELYEEIGSKYEVRLCTESCFGKLISWTHILEDVLFIPVLHGDELILNSGLNYDSDAWLRQFIYLLNQHDASGLIMALRPGQTFSPEIIAYCNDLHFPLFAATWKTPYMDISRQFSMRLLKNEQTETNLITAFKNAIDYPENRELYRTYFEEAGYRRHMKYIVIMLSCHTYDTSGGNPHLEQIRRSLRYSVNRGIIYEENGVLVILSADRAKEEIVPLFQELCRRDGNICVGVGSVARYMRDIHSSYEAAATAYQLTKTAIHKNFLDYDELGVYKILSDVKNADVYPKFVEETLGKLLAYDQENHTRYVHILEAYFAHECNMVNTAEALYCHKNTMAYKLNKIRDILGYDILTNENRTKIMLAFYIIRLGNEYFFE